MGDCDKKVTGLSAQIKALNEEKVKIEGVIKSLSIASAMAYLFPSSPSFLPGSSRI